VRGFLVDEWLPAVEPSLRASTHKLYETLATAYVVPRIGDVRLQKLSPGTLNRLYADLLAGGAREGKPLGAETTRKVHRLMHRALRDAVKWGRVTQNGSGTATTSSFKVPSSWNLGWSYDCSQNLGGQGNFIVDIYDDYGQKSQPDFDNQGINQLGAKGQGVEHYHSGGNSKFLKIGSECPWTVTVTKP
jgi:hypothetical protein